MSCRAPTNPFGTATDKAARVALVKAFSREQCLVAARMGGLPQALLMAIESRLRRLAGTSGTSTRPLSDAPLTVAIRTRRQLCQRRKALGAR